MIRGLIVPSPIAVIGAFGLTACWPAQYPFVAKTYKARLTAKDEVPPNASAATADGTFTFDAATKQLTWSVTFTGLSGPAAAAHIHRPAAPGANAGVVVAFDVPKAPAGEIKGSTLLVTEQVNDLQSGKYYVNIHTAANKGGEIRGQIMP